MVVVKDDLARSKSDAHTNNQQTLHVTPALGHINRLQPFVHGHHGQGKTGYVLHRLIQVSVLFVLTQILFIHRWENRRADDCNSSGSIST